MGMLDWINPFNKVTDLAAEFIEDKDKRNALNAAIEQLREQVYMKELDVKTVPWVDALHKMGRQINSWAMMGVTAFLIYQQPDINPLLLAAVGGPAAIYNAVKGKGK